MNVVGAAGGERLPLPPTADGTGSREKLQPTAIHRPACVHTACVLGLLSKGGQQGTGWGMN